MLGVLGLCSFGRTLGEEAFSDWQYRLCLKQGRAKTMYVYLQTQQTNKRPASLQAFVLNGAGTKSRTRDLLITSQLLYQLSYTGVLGAQCIDFFV
jgi:hypothetical protein